MNIHNQSCMNIHSRNFSWQICHVLGLNSLLKNWTDITKIIQGYYLYSNAPPIKATLFAKILWSCMGCGHGYNVVAFGERVWTLA